MPRQIIDRDIASSLVILEYAPRTNEVRMSSSELTESLHSIQKYLKCQVRLDAKNFICNNTVNSPQRFTILLNHSYQIICLDQRIFDNDPQLAAYN